ncbi:MAG TPA: FAD/NAD(P)-binding oxidoreductase [Longimicrobiaceae bacterium]|nr:FAD/NAD(P)-binding oxidoreductase [Longimicrobiaceae bacterium]
MGEAGRAHLEADLAVVGAGPAGIAAAVAAREAGRRVVVLDESPRAGGQIWRHTSPEKLPRAARRWLARLERSGARVLHGGSVVDAREGFELTLQHPEVSTVSAETVVLATGARELFLPFPGWTLPNVLGVGGAQALLKQGADFRGKRVVISGSGPLLLPVAAALAKGGARVLMVAEQAPAARVLRFASSLWRSPERMAQAARARLAFRGTPYLLGTWVTRAEGDSAVRAATLTDGRRSWTEACDLLCAGWGLVPDVRLATLLGCEIERGRVRVDGWQETTREGVFCAGEPTGVGGVEAALLEGEIAGFAAVGQRYRAARFVAARDRDRAFAARMERAFAPREELRHLPEPDTVVCRCEDVPLGALSPEWSARQGKLYTRAGMGPCQGRICGPALECLFGWEDQSVRSPVVNATVDTLLQH